MSQKGEKIDANLPRTTAFPEGWSSDLKGRIKITLKHDPFGPDYESVERITKGKYSGLTWRCNKLFSETEKQRNKFELRYKNRDLGSLAEAEAGPKLPRSYDYESNAYELYNLYNTKNFREFTLVPQSKVKKR